MLAALLSCSDSVKVSRTLDAMPAIFPDYNGVVIPPNMAPLNFALDDQDAGSRAVLFQKLIEIGTLFSDGKDWSPSKIVRHYRDKGLIRGDYLRIAWRNKQDLNITTE